MDKYEFTIKMDEIKKLVAREEYSNAAVIADSIDWQKVKNTRQLVICADVYHETGQIAKEKEVLSIAYEKMPMGRQLAYRLCLASIALEDFEDAEEYYEDFVELAPSDTAQYLLKYQLLKAERAEKEELIEVLETFIEDDLEEEWAAELAELYLETNQREKCIELCDEVMLWFREGPYVKKVAEIKQTIAPLTKSQQTMYDDIISAETKAYEKARQDTFKVTLPVTEEELFRTVEFQKELAKDLESILDEPETPDSAQEEADEAESEEAASEPSEETASEPSEETVPEPSEETVSEPTGEAVLSEEEVTAPEPEEVVAAVPEETVSDDDTAEEKMEEPEEAPAAAEPEDRLIELTTANLPLDEIDAILTDLSSDLDTLFATDEDISSEEENQGAAEEDLTADEEAADDNLYDSYKAEEEGQEEKYYLSDEYKDVFRRYLRMNGVENQIATAMKNVVMNPNSEGSSAYNNIVITGEAKSGKTSLALEMFKVINAERGKEDRKAAKINSSAINRRGLQVSMPKLLGMDLIIADAGSLSKESVVEMMDILRRYTAEMIVVLMDSRRAIEHLFTNYPLLEEMFSNVVNLQEYDINEWVIVAREYAKKKGYFVDDMGTLALYAKIDGLYGLNRGIELKDIETIVDDAIVRNSKFSVSGVFRKKTRAGGLKILREVDFK